MASAQMINSFRLKKYSLSLILWLVVSLTLLYQRQSNLQHTPASKLNVLQGQ